MSGLLALDLAPAPLLPKSARELGTQQIGRKECVVDRGDPECCFRQRLWNKPFDHHAGVHHEAAQRSRSSRINSVLSDSIRPRNLSCHDRNTASASSRV